MPIFAESKKEIFADVLGDVLTNTNITQTSPGSKARALVEAVTNKLGDIWVQFDQNMAHAFLDGAEGKYLDYFGDMFGLARNGEKPAIVAAADRVIKFYRTDTSTAVSIPQGTVVSTLPNGQGVIYKTTATVPLGIGDAAAYVAARSKTPGRDSNVGKDTLIYHEFANDSISVTNEADILSGVGIESDENYRFRISKYITSSETANHTAIRMAALSVPGVADVQIMPFFRGVGTFDLLIKSVSPSVSSQLISNVKEALYFTVAQGVSFDVRGPKETGASVQVSVTLKEPVSEPDEALLRENIQAAIFYYLDNLDIGEPLLVNELVQIVMGVSSNIKTMGVAGKPIDNITLYKETDLTTTKIPETLFSLGGASVDYVPEIDEKVITELQYIQTENPITVIIG